MVNKWFWFFSSNIQYLLQLMNLLWNDVTQHFPRYQLTTHWKLLFKYFNKTWIMFSKQLLSSIEILLIHSVVFNQIIGSNKNKYFLRIASSLSFKITSKSLLKILQRQSKTSSVWYHILSYFHYRLTIAHVSFLIWTFSSSSKLIKVFKLVGICIKSSSIANSGRY